MMLAAQRREKILQLIQEDGHAKVLELSKLFKVTEVTIRQDLERMERQGLIVREHGGACLSDAGLNVKDLTLMNQNHLEEKKAIARKALTFIHDGETIILDSGSTTTEIAKLMVGFTNLTVITNAINIALILGSMSGINLNVTGGEFKSPTLSLTGMKAANYLENIHADKVFLATAGINLKTGLTYPSISDLVVKKTMIEVSDVVYLVADSSKIGTSSFASLGALSLVDHIITDSNITPEDEEVFKKYDVKYTVAQIG